MGFMKNRIFLCSLLITVVAFIAFIFPNNVGSQNLAMVGMFQPDEAAPLPTVLDMIGPANSIEQAIRSFIFYDYYYYGFPYFSVSALTLLPLKWLGQVDNLQLVMLILRQMVSLLPMLAALLLLVYMHDGFRSYRSPILLLLLLSIPAVTRNSLWWHPDGLIFLLVVLTLFFLKQDNLRFGWNFLVAAVMSGIATATKLMGVYFFLAVALTILLGFLYKKVSWKKLVLMGAGFILVMGIAYLLANPFLVSGWARTAYGYTFHKQMGLLSEGYGVIYERGPIAAWPFIQDSLGV